MSFKSSLLPLLSNDGKKFAISTRTPNGQYGQPLTKDGTLEDIKEFLIDIGLVPEDTASDMYNINIQNMSKYFAKKLQSIIQDENHILYKKFIEYRVLGIQNDFQMNLERILDRELDSSHNISSDINHMVQELYDNFLRIDITRFKTNDYKYRFNNNRNHDAVIPEYDYDTLKKCINEFDALINMIIMSILVEYGRKNNQRYFQKNSVLKTKVSSIKNHLFKIIQKNQHKLDEVLFCSFHANKSLVRKYEVITGVDVRAETILNIVISKGDISNHRSRYAHDIKTTIEIPDMILTNDNEMYYSALLDMLGKINFIEEFLNHLIDSCSDTSEQNGTTQSQKLLQLLSISNTEISL